MITFQVVVALLLLGFLVIEIVRLLKLHFEEVRAYCDAVFVLSLLLFTRLCLLFLLYLLRLESQCLFYLSHSLSSVIRALVGLVALTTLFLFFPHVRLVIACLLSFTLLILLSGDSQSWLIEFLAHTLVALASLPLLLEPLDTFLRLLSIVGVLSITLVIGLVRLFLLHLLHTPPALH